jgi:hypothetical protein
VADKVEAAGTKIMKGKGIKGFPAPSSTTEPPQASFVQRRERHLRLFFRTNFQRGSFFMSGHNIEVILSIAHDGPLLTGDWSRRQSDAKDIFTLSALYFLQDLGVQER